MTPIISHQQSMISKALTAAPHGLTCYELSDSTGLALQVVQNIVKTLIDLGMARPLKNAATNQPITRQSPEGRHVDVIYSVPVCNPPEHFPSQFN